VNKFVISPADSVELTRLNAELLIAQQHVATALLTRSRPLKGPALAQLMEEERKLSVITRRIRELKGE
jgi:hypothetical protein